VKGEKREVAMGDGRYTMMGQRLFIFQYQAKFEANFSGRYWKYKLYFKKAYNACFDA
jgi:hypothetical protein